MSSRRHRALPCRCSPVFSGLATKIRAVTCKGRTNLELAQVLELIAVWTISPQSISEAMNAPRQLLKYQRKAVLDSSTAALPMSVCRHLQIPGCSTGPGTGVLGTSSREGHRSPAGASAEGAVSLRSVQCPSACAVRTSSPYSACIL